MQQEDDGGPAAVLLRPGVVVGHSPGDFRRLASSESAEPRSAVYSGSVGDRIWLDHEEEHLLPGPLKIMVGCLEMAAVSFLMIAGAYLLVTRRQLLFGDYMSGGEAAAAAADSQQKNTTNENEWLSACGPFIVVALCTDLIMYATCGLVTVVLGLVCGNGRTSFHQASGFISVSVFALSSIVWMALLVVGCRLLAEHWRPLWEAQRLLLAWLVTENAVAVIYVLQAAPFFIGIFKYLGHKVVHKLKRHPLVSWNQGEEPSWWWVADFQRRYPTDAVELGLLPR